MSKKSGNTVCIYDVKEKKKISQRLLGYSGI